MEEWITVHFFKGMIEGRDGWHFAVGCDKEIPTHNYVLFCDYLQDALDALTMSESEAEKKHLQRLI